MPVPLYGHCLFYAMGIEIKILDKLISFFDKLKQKSEQILLDLKYMKFEQQFGEREDDIYVATYLKTGTTWMQMILYQLTTDGNTDFKHIYDVSPWPRNSSMRGLPVPDVPSPRILKTHDPYKKFAKGKPGRFIVVLRDGRDVALSLYHHRKNYNNSKLTFDENFNISFKDPGEMNWFSHTWEWLNNSNKHKILYVRYEDLKQNFEHELNRIAQFIGVEIKPEALPRIIEKSSFAFMKQHEEKFGEQPPEEKHEIVYNNFIRSGNAGDGSSYLNDEDKAFFSREFKIRFSQFEQMKKYNT